MMSVIQKQSANKAHEQSITSNSKRRVLFLCTANSARSQMAEAILRHKSGDIFEVFSAGTQPDKIDENTLIALHKFGLPIDNLSAKNMDDLSGQAFDYVITLCNKATQECRVHPWFAEQAVAAKKGQLMSWDFPDPKTRTGLDPFAQTLTELNSRIAMFVLVESKKQPDVNNSNSEHLDTVKTDFEPIAFYKCLTDEIRLKTLMLVKYYGELCVCELMTALQEQSQPKVSRNLALLRKAKLLIDRKHGQWVFYRINPYLPEWARSVLATTAENNINYIHHNIVRIAKMKDRPDKSKFCC